MGWLIAPEAMGIYDVFGVIFLGLCLILLVALIKDYGLLYSNVDGNTHVAVARVNAQRGNNVPSSRNAHITVTYRRHATLMDK